MLKFPHPKHIQSSKLEAQGWVKREGHEKGERAGRRQVARVRSTSVLETHRAKWFQNSKVSIF